MKTHEIHKALGLRGFPGGLSKDEMVRLVDAVRSCVDKALLDAALSRAQAAPAVGVPDAAFKLGRNSGLEDAKRAVAALNCPQDENNFEAACMYAMHAIESLKDNTP